MAQRRRKFSLRNLTKSQLGGVVFGCTKDTIKECMSKQLFGLPYNHISYVQKIDIGLPLFLFNYSDRKLHGIFEAAGSGQLNIDRYGWTSDGSEKTSYPAQVQINLKLQCEPLSEEKFKPAVADNYYSSHHFWFELDHFQTTKLMCLLTSFAVKPTPSMNASNRRQNFHLCPSDEKKENSDKIKPSENELVDSLEVSLGTGRESDSTAAVSHLGISENNPDIQNPKQTDEDEVLEKVKDLTLSHEHGDNSVMKIAEQANIPTCKNLEVSLGTGRESDSVAVASHVGISENHPDIQNPKHTDEDYVLEKLKDPTLNHEHGDSNVMKIVEQANIPTCKNLELSLGTGMEYDSAAAASHLGISENHPDIQNPKQFDEDYALEKLKDPALGHEQGDNRVMKIIEQANIPTCKNVEDNDKPEEETCSEGERDGSSLVSSPRQHAVNQLMHEVKELRAFGLENFTKICYLEEKLDEAHKEIHRLSERCDVLESIHQTILQSGPLTAIDGGSGMEIYSPDDLSLDPKEAILLLGGFDGGSESWLSSVQLYFPSKNVVKAHSSMSCIRSNASVAKLNGEIYIFGGDDGGHGWSNVVESYNQTDGQWSLCPPLNERKGSLGGASLDGKLFAIGGGNGVVSFSDVEMLDPDIGRWIRTRSMNQKRFAVASVEHNGSIYAVGGFDGGEYLNTAERFDPREHSWMTIASMKSRRGCHSLVILNEKLYAIGGYDGETMVSSVEIYDPRTGTWIPGEPMKDIKGYSAAAVVRDSMYIIGGYKGEEEDILDTVECFKEGEGWKNVPCSSIGRRCFLSAVAL